VKLTERLLVGLDPAADRKEDVETPIGELRPLALASSLSKLKIMWAKGCERAR
jgi:hypothetical protein